MSIAAAATGTKRIAVLLVNFTNNTAQPWTTAAVRGVVFDNPGSVAAYYQDASVGQLTLSGDVYGWLTIPDDNAGCDYSGWGGLARTAATNAGVNLSNYTNVVYAWPTASSCAWAGLAYLPGRDSFINGSMSLRVVGHELGHNFGVHHASTLNCTSAGTRVTLGGTCTANEYGDPFTIMGSASTYHHNNWHRAQFGWMSMQTVSSSGTYTLAPAESSSTAESRLLRVARGDGTYLNLEFRQPGGAFETFSSSSALANGISVRIAPETSTLVQSKLLDFTPGTATFLDAPLGVGSSFTDQVANVTISTIAVSPLGASVSIQFGTPPGDTTPPSAPGSLTATATSSVSVSLAWTAATDNVGVSGYRILRDGVQIGTTTGLSYTDGGRTASTTYAYEVRAFDGAGNVGPGATANVTTPPRPDVSPPSTPGSLTATATSSISVSLAWTAATDNVGVSGYRILRGGVQIGTTTGLSYTDGGRTASTTYAYEVRAFDGAGNVGLGATASVTTPPMSDVSPPSPAPILSFTLGNGRKVDLRWTASQDSSAVTYRVNRNGSTILQTSGLSMMDRPGRGTFTYIVQAFDAFGNTVASNTVQVTN